MHRSIVKRIGKSLILSAKFSFARLVAKLRKVPQKSSILAENSSQNLSQMTHDSQDFSVPESDREKNVKFPSNIETFPDLLSEEDLLKAAQKVAPTIDEIFVKDIKETRNIDSAKWQKMKKKFRNFPASSLIKITKTFAENPKFHKKDSLWIPLENEFSARLHKMSFEEIIQILWCFAYANRRNREFFRRIENELYDREWNMVHINHIGKMLWAFSFADLGSSELYSKIAHTIKIVQYEIPPLKLAEYANYFSKSSENIQGGFGVYKVAEKRLSETLQDYNFHDLVKIALMMIPQSIGSNDFYKKLEERILDTFPHKEQISMPDLVRIAKAMAFHRYQNTGLRDRIENNVMKYAEFMSNSQLEDTLWAFTRGRKGSKVLYDKLENEFLKRIELFKPRSLAFAYYGLASMRMGSAEFYKSIHEKIEEKLFLFNPHCLLKIMKGMQIMNSNAEIRDVLIERLLQIKTLKLTEMLKLLMIISESDIRISGENQSLYINLFTLLLLKFNENLPHLKIDEKCQIFYAYVLHNKFTEQDFQMVVQEIPSANSVPKSIFCQTLWAAIQSKHFEFAREFIPIVNNLKSFGDIKYFFDHDSFIKLSWSLIILNFNASIEENQNFTIEKSIWGTSKEAILDINPNTLKAIENVGLWLQTLGLLNTVVEIEEREIKQKISEINDFTKKSLANSSKLRINNPENEKIRSEIVKFIGDVLEEKPIEGVEIELFQCFFDDLFNFIDVALIWGKGKRSGIRVKSKRDYLFEEFGKKELYLMKCEMNDRLLESVFGWSLFPIEEMEWKSKKDSEKKFIISDFLKKIKKE